MKRIILILFISSLISTLPAQEKHSYIGLQSGPSFPVGKYHAKDLATPAKSFATTGVSVSLEGAWFFKPWLGIGGQAGIHFHPVDVWRLGYEIMLKTPELNDLYIRSESYRNLTLYAGLYFDKPVVQRLSVTAKALGGVLFSQTPYQLYKADFYIVGKNWYEVTSAGDFEGSFMAGAGLKYMLKNCIGFTLNGEFTYNMADFNFTDATGNTRTDKKVIAFVNLDAGVILKIR